MNEHDFREIASYTLENGTCVIFLYSPSNGSLAFVSDDPFSDVFSTHVPSVLSSFSSLDAALGFLILRFSHISSFLLLV